MLNSFPSMSISICSTVQQKKKKKKKKKKNTTNPERTKYWPGPGGQAAGCSTSRGHNVLFQKKKIYIQLTHF